MTTYTGAGIDSFRLLSLKAMIKMEKAGLKQRGGALRPRLAKELGLSPRAPHDEYVAAIEKKVSELKIAKEDIA